MRIPYGVEHAEEEVEAIVDREALGVTRFAGAKLGDDVLHGLPVEVLHHEIDLSAFVATDVVHGDDPRMLELADDSNLVGKAQEGSFRHGLPRDALHRHGP